MCLNNAAWRVSFFVWCLRGVFAAGPVSPPESPSFPQIPLWRGPQFRLRAWCLHGLSSLVDFPFDSVNIYYIRIDVNTFCENINIRWEFFYSLGKGF